MYVYTPRYTHIHACLYACIQLHTVAYIHTYIHKYVHAYIHACICTYSCMHTDIHTHAHRQNCMHTYMLQGDKTLSVHTSIYIYIHIHIHIYKNPLWLTYWNSWNINETNICNVFFANATWTTIWFHNFIFWGKVSNDADSLISSGITGHIFGQGR